MRRGVLAAIAIVLVAGCTSDNPQETPVPTTPAASDGEAPVPQTSSGPNAGAKGPGLDINPFNGSYLADQMAGWVANSTDDMSLRFTLEAPEGTPCTVVAKANYHLDLSKGGFFVLEGSSGAAFVHSSGAPMHIGPVDLGEQGNSNDWVYEVKIGGESWGSTPYTIGAENLHWWQNDLLENATFSVQASCESDFSIESVRASATGSVFTNRDFQGGFNLGVANALENLDLEAIGEDAMLLGRTFGVTEYVRLLGSHSEGAFSWDTIADPSSDGFMVEQVGAGMLHLELDASSQTVGFLWGDLPPCNVVCQVGLQ